MSFPYIFLFFSLYFLNSNLLDGIILSLERFTGYRILIWQFFSLSTLQILNYLGFMLLLEDNCSVASLNVISSLLVFRFFCVFGFSTILLYVVNFFLLILLASGIWLCLIASGKFSTVNLFKYCLCPVLFSPFLRIPIILSSIVLFLLFFHSFDFAATLWMSSLFLSSLVFSLALLNLLLVNFRFFWKFYFVL